MGLVGAIMRHSKRANNFLSERSKDKDATYGPEIAPSRIRLSTDWLPVI